MDIKKIKHRIFIPMLRCQRLILPLVSLLLMIIIIIQDDKRGIYMSDQFNLPEQLFIDHFVNRNRRDRIRYELSNKNKRKKCIWSFSEPHRHIFIDDKIHFLPSNISRDQVLKAFIQKGCTKSESVYIMHIDSYLDKTTRELYSSLSDLWFTGPCVIISEKQIALLIIESGDKDFEKVILE